MNNKIVRIESIYINNFKNVINGEITLNNNRVPYNTSILGLYGQNGSGKTALIDSIALLKFVLSGQSIPTKYSDYINVESDFATLKFILSIDDLENNNKYIVHYEFSIRKDYDISSNNIDLGNIDKEYKVTIFNESISFSYYNTKDPEINQNKQVLINTNTDKIFIPNTKFEILIGKNKLRYTDLLVAKKLTLTTSRSFIFSKELLDIIKENCFIHTYLTVLNSLVFYGNYGLVVINTDNSSLIGLNALPLSFKYTNTTHGAVGHIAIPLESKAVIPQEASALLKKIINNMNIVLNQLVPGLTINVKELGSQTLKNGNTGVEIELFSNKNNKEIPLIYESEGIKKIISILQLLITIYNDPSVTVAIDELDAGVFEYLLGELLRVLSEKGKGQLIFTSHNLRVLETLDKGFIAFTTTNPQKRYIRFNNIKTNHNLRDFYYRDIVLGEQKEEVYEMTNNYEIALAFREAGELSGS